MPREVQAVAMPSWDYVCVEVEDVLNCGLSRVVLHVHTLRGERRLEQTGDSMHHCGNSAVRVLGDLPEVLCVCAGNYEGVSRGSGSDVQNRHRVLVLEDPIRRQPAGDYLAEDTLTHAGHDRTRYLPRATGFQHPLSSPRHDRRQMMRVATVAVPR